MNSLLVLWIIVEVLSRKRACVCVRVVAVVVAVVVVVVFSVVADTHDS